MRKLKIRLHGPFSATWSDGQPLDVKSAKLIALLALLATAPEGMRTRAWLQGRLWSLSGAELGRASLRRALSDLRKLFGDEFDRTFEVSNSQIRLKPQVVEPIGVETDGAFLEGIDITDPAFKSWLLQMRSSKAVAPTRTAVADRAPERSFSSPSVAVIPFSISRDERSGETLGDMFAQEVTRTLSKAKIFVVFSHLLARKFGQTNVDLSDIARDYAIDFVIYGTIRSLGDDLKIDVDIANTKTGRLCATQEYSVSVTELLDDGSDFLSGVGQHATEAIVLATVEQRLSNHEISDTTAGMSEEFPTHDDGLFFEHGHDKSQSYDATFTRGSEHSEFRTWLSRWYIEHLENSGIEAIRLKSSDAARKYFQKALDVANDLGGPAERERTVNRLLLLLGPQMFTNYGFASEKVQSVYARARRQLPSEGHRQQRLQTLWGIWGAELVKADLSAAETLCDEFLQTAGDGADALEMSVGCYMSGVCEFYQGHFTNAEDAFEKASLYSETVDLHDAITKYGMNIGLIARCYLGWAYALMGKSEKAAKTSQRAALDAGQLDHPFSQALGYCILATVHNFLDEICDAKRFGLMAKELCQENGFAQQEAHAQINLGRVNEREGNTSGLQMMLDGQRAYFDTQAALARPYTDAWIGEALLARQDTRNALRRVLGARRFTRKNGERYFDAELLRLSALAMHALRPEQKERAKDLLQAAVDLAGEIGSHLQVMKASNDLTKLQRERPSRAS